MKHSHRSFTQEAEHAACEDHILLSRASKGQHVDARRYHFHTPELGPTYMLLQSSSIIA